MDNIITWVKGNLLMVGAGLAAIWFFFLRKRRRRSGGRGRSFRMRRFGRRY